MLSNGTPADKSESESVSAQHLSDLRASGLSDSTIAAAGIYSESNPDTIAALLNWKGGGDRLGACLVFPYLGADGQPNCYATIKADSPRIDKERGKPRKYELPKGKSNRAYIPPAVRAAIADPSAALLITEGIKKCLKAVQEGFPTIALSGVWNWCKPRKKVDGKGVGPFTLIDDLAEIAWAGRTAFIVFDSDAATNESVRAAEGKLAEALTAAGALVRIIRLPAEPDGSKNGLDDYLVRHGADGFRRLVGAAAPPVDTRPKITISTAEFLVNREAVKALTNCDNLYQRGGLLVRATRIDTDAGTDDSIRRPLGTTIIKPLAAPILREMLSKYARWVTIRETRDGPVECAAHPPGWSVNALAAYDSWDGIHRLEAVVDHPVFLTDGTVFRRNGYDPRSRLFVSIPDDLGVSVPDSPTKHGLADAVDVLDDAVRDFPFQRPEHKAAWFAGLLTPLAWFSFNGPAPMLLIDGNTRGCGKGLLADVIALIVTGRRFPIMSYTNDREELKKRITTLAVEGDRLVLLDNLAGAVGSDTLDAALTADTWKDRLLGANKIFNGPLHVCWYATGNNVALRADTSRRCSHCRLETPDERPELKGGFRYPDLRAHVRDNRGVLLSAALTILRGWHVAGRPKHNLSPWGSYEQWSDVVREAVVFAGLPDPGLTREALQTAADTDAEAMAALIDAMEQIDPERRGLATGEIIDLIRKPSDPAPAWLNELRAAVEELAGKLDSRVLGYRFRHFARRNFGGKMIDRAGEDRQRGIRWAVRSAIPNRPKTSPASPASPASRTPTAGDAGDAGDGSAREKSGANWRAF